MHSLAVSDPAADSQYLVAHFWNHQTVNLYEMKALLSSPSDQLVDSLTAKVNIDDFAPFKALDIDQVHAFQLASFSYLIVTLSNGYVLCFNLYPSALKAAADQR